jgi:non-ribosomal peptide synthetase component E (peptide arylation enzyme)
LVIDKSCNLSIQTYNTLRIRAEQLASGLQNLGLKQGDKLMQRYINNGFEPDKIIRAIAP